MPIEKPNNGQGYKPRTLQEIFREMPDMEIPAWMAAARSERPKTPTQDLSRSIRILYHRGANHPDSMRILEEHNLRPLTYKEVLAILTENEEIKEQLKGKWFWIAGKGSDKEGFHHFDGTDLVEGRVDDIERNVNCWYGKGRLMFGVREQAVTVNSGVRFVLDAGSPSAVCVSAVVGVPKQPEIT